MKSLKTTRSRTIAPAADDSGRRAVKLAPNKKSGKERHAFFRDLEDDDPALDYRPRRESALDYLDDEQ